MNKSVTNQIEYELQNYKIMEYFMNESIRLLVKNEIDTKKHPDIQLCLDSLYFYMDLYETGNSSCSRVASEACTLHSFVLEACRP